MKYKVQIKDIEQHVLMNRYNKLQKEVQETLDTKLATDGLKCKRWFLN